jgi:hypothetical protein
MSAMTTGASAEPLQVGLEVVGWDEWEDVAWGDVEEVYEKEEEVS